PEDVRKWLGKHGYPLGLQTARRFQAAGFDVTHSSFYEDPETGKPREIDIIASKDLVGGKWGIRVTFFVECKAGQKQSWVLIGTPAASVNGNGRLLAAVQSDRAKLLGPYLRRVSPVGDEALWKRSTNPVRGLIRVAKSNEDVAYATMMSLVSAATSQVAFAD